ncbi:MAG TPA: cobalamin-independent methionine synthase II family protein [Desulfotignum sp.]|nr:cobalamin-independent methionine synthase II family protein [Desulfotignum sp.]
MTIQTTTIGAWPKPPDIPIPDWFQGASTTAKNPTEALDACETCRDDQTLVLLDQATKEVVAKQAAAGIDIPTDGELRRENYIHYHCRHLAGFDFNRLTEKYMRAGAWAVKVPTITGKIKPGRPFLVRDWQVAQSATNRPVKITMPGPMTIADSVADEFYKDDRRLGRVLAEALNMEILRLARAGCRWVQVDEPLFARFPEKALAYGMENLERCFFGAGDQLNRATHICCGYPDKLDSTDYPKASPDAYFRLAPALDDAAVDVVSLEDAHRPNDLFLLEKFKATTIILGVIGIARTRIESADEIESRLRAALAHIDKNRLMAGPDCGLGMLPLDIIMDKLQQMKIAVNRIT